MLGAARGNRADDGRMGCDDKLGLRNNVRLGNIDFHVQGAFDPQRARLREIVLGWPGFIDGWRVGEPRVAEPVGVNEVQVGIENAHECLLLWTYGVDVRWDICAAASRNRAIVSWVPGASLRSKGAGHRRDHGAERSEDR